VIPQTPLGAGREFDLIRELCRRWGELCSGIGDDAAVLTPPPGEQLVLTTDSSVEGRHFRRDWLTPREIGYRAAAAAISDVAAMAASPLGMLLALSIPAEWLRDLAALADGIGDAARLTGTPIVGGDVSSGSELVINVTVVGSARKPLGRGGVQPGQALYVTGRLGGPDAALRAWLGDSEPAADARARFAHPVPRLAEARWLATRGATAMIDVSDGLLGDAGHLAAASDLRIAIELGDLLIMAGVSPEQAARSGEEYELIAAAPPTLDMAAFTRETGVPISRIGKVIAGPPGVDVTLRGERVASAGGFSHF
jgi:thiamine-monophosphate kinase